MQDLSFNIPMGKGKASAHARLYKTASGIYGLTLHDGHGQPTGKGRSLSDAQARHLAKAINSVKPTWRAGLVWAALGYERKSKKAIASTRCHPGAFRVSGRA